MPPKSIGISTFSSDVMCGSRLKFWKTNPTRRLRISASWSRVTPATFSPPSWYVPVGRRVEAAEEVHERRFAGAGGADDRHHLALVDLEVDAFERFDFHLAGVVDLADLAPSG